MTEETQPTHPKIGNSNLLSSWKNVLCWRVLCISHIVLTWNCLRLPGNCMEPPLHGGRCVVMYRHDLIGFSLNLLLTIAIWLEPATFSRAVVAVSELWGGFNHETRSMKVHFCNALLLFYLQKIDTVLLGTFHYAINTTTVIQEVQKYLFPFSQNPSAAFW